MSFQELKTKIRELQKDIQQLLWQTEQLEKIERARDDSALRFECNAKLAVKARQYEIDRLKEHAREREAALKTLEEKITELEKAR
jgi:predicted RNase H-like nuclease (RuvC/YqgF family)